jgi:hypothetical protein
MSNTFNRGDHVEWNSEAGWIRGTVIRKSACEDPGHKKGAENIPRAKNEILSGWSTQRQPERRLYGRARQFFANCFLMLSMSLREGGQFASQVLQCKTKVSDFNAASNSFRVNITVKLWLLGQTVSSFA